VQNVDFSFGGFQAKFGDKLSSFGWPPIEIRCNLQQLQGSEISLKGSLSVDAVSIENGQQLLAFGIEITVCW
jgi:hypothetical protein